MNLSERLQAIAVLAAGSRCLADIGTDHAQLPIWLVENKKIMAAIAADVNSGPYNIARRAVRQAGLAERIAVRQGDGLNALRLGEVDAVAIAGMGGTTIRSILAQCPWPLTSIDKLILQPMNDSAILRLWLRDHGWRIAAEDLVLEDRLYEVIMAQPGQQEMVEDILMEIGPCLWRDRHELLGRHLAELIAAQRRILAAMSRSETARGSHKFQQITEKVGILCQLAAKV